MEQPKGKLFETKDYLKFSFLKGNRKVKENKDLERSIKNSGILVPIEVNENFQILDGQKRYFIAERLNLPIPYRIARGLGIDDVIDLNSTTKSWNLLDYVYKFAKEGKEPYVKLCRLIKMYSSIPASSLVSSATGYVRLNTGATKKAKIGDFHFFNYEEFTRYLEDFDYFCNQTGIKVSQQIYFAYFSLYATPKFDVERLIDGVKAKNKHEIEGVYHQGAVLEFFLKAYNYGISHSSKKAIRYQLNHNGDPFITESINLALVREV